MLLTNFSAFATMFEPKRAEVATGTTGANVRFGSKADMARSNGDVRFTPKSGHSLARQHVRLVPKGDQARRTKIAEWRSC
jgi:hypothetical protein